jgi:hypothetical protein
MSEVSSRDTKLSHAPDLVGRLIDNALRGLQFGTITLIVQDGKVIQVDRTEKTRVRRERRQGTVSGE